MRCSDKQHQMCLNYICSIKLLMALDVESWKWSLKDFYLDPKDNMWRKSDAYACAHSRHILILLILSFSLKCAALLCLFALTVTVHVLTFHMVSRDKHITSRLIKVVCCSESCSHPKKIQTKKTFCIEPCEFIRIISRFKQLCLS